MKTCGICSHPERAAINAALVAGESLRDIEAGHNGTTRSALDRHRKHIPAALTVAKQAEEVADATTLLSRIERLLSRCETLFEGAATEKKWAGAAAVAREIRGLLELVGKLSGELKNAGMKSESTPSFQATLALMSDEEIEAELNAMFGPDCFRETKIPPPVEFTEVERLIRCGFLADSESVRTAIKEKEAAVKAYQASISPPQALTIPGVQYQIESQTRNQENPA